MSDFECNPIGTRALADAAIEKVLSERAYYDATLPQEQIVEAHARMVRADREMVRLVDESARESARQAAVKQTVVTPEQMRAASEEGRALAASVARATDGVERRW